MMLSHSFAERLFDAHCRMESIGKVFHLYLRLTGTSVDQNLRLKSKTPCLQLVQTLFCISIRLLQYSDDGVVHRLVIQIQIRQTSVSLQLFSWPVLGIIHQHVLCGRLLLRFSVLALRLRYDSQIQGHGRR